MPNNINYLLGFVPHPNNPTSTATLNSLTFLNSANEMQYRRTYVPGGTYFFTVNLADRSQRLLVDHIGVLRLAMKKVMPAHPFHIDAIVILPEHIHALWTLPEGDSDFSTRWSLIKAGFSRHIPAKEHRNHSRIMKGERGIWQRRFWEHMIQNQEDYQKHVEYIHYNSVKHGHAPRVCDWPYSSFHRYVREGVYHHDWGCDKRIIKSEQCWGEGRTLINN